MKITSLAVAGPMRRVARAILRESGARTPYVQVVPIFFKSDSEIFGYFSDHRDEIDAITGSAVHIVLPQSVLTGDASDVASALDAQDRYPGLKAGDLPCLWVEGSGNLHFVIKLPHALPDVKDLLYALVDAARAANTFADVAASFKGRVTQAANGPPVATVKRIVISLHGIRTRGTWQKELQTSCDQANAGLQHRPFDFGFFGALQLLIPFMRERKVKWFLDEYTHLVKEERLTTPPSVIAHSFGSYVVASAMELHPEVVFDRIILCGSIVRRNYEWKDLVRRKQAIRVLNDYGRKDSWVRVAEWLIADAGSSGYRGFEDTAAGGVIQRQHPGWRHSDYFYRLNYDRNWIPFILGAHDPDEGQQERPRGINWRFQIARGMMLAALAYAAYRLWPRSVE